VFNPEETAENLRKSGAIIIGRRPGNQTKEYLQYIDYLH
jgi:preprotein translocase subunit SecY